MLKNTRKPRKNHLKQKRNWLYTRKSWWIAQMDGWKVKGKVAMLTLKRKEKALSRSYTRIHNSANSLHIFLAIKHTFHCFRFYSVPTFTNNFHSQNCNRILLLHVFELLMSMSHCNNWRNLCVRRQSINMSSNKTSPINS